MTKLDADTFVTRQEAADTLRVTPRTVDRMAEDGALTKFRLGKRRSGFRLADIEAHIARQNGGAVLANPPTSQPASRADYQSPGSGMIEEVPGMTAHEAEAFNKLLVKVGLPGIMLVLTRGHLILTWPDALGYTEDMIDKKLAKAVRKGER